METKSKKEANRIQRIQEPLKKRNLQYPDEIDTFGMVNVRSKETIAKRAIVSGIMAKCAFDLYESNDKNVIVKECKLNLEKFGVSDDLYKSEKRVLRYKKDDGDLVGWGFEAAKALLWALGLIDELDDSEFPEDIVIERRRALQWLVYSDEDDDGTWYDLTFDT